MLTDQLRSCTSAGIYHTGVYGTYRPICYAQHLC